MKKILLSILMLLLTVTAAWAGDGDGTKDHPFSGVWQASELASRIDKGKNLYLAYDCDIQNGTITVIDSKLNTQIANGWPAWSPGNVLGSSNYSGYDEYYRNNSLGDRRSQLFIITDASRFGSSIYMTGYFSGSYDQAGIVMPTKKVGDIEYYVINNAEDYETFRHIVATGNPYANAVLEANITVTKPIGSGDAQFHYRGTFDGQGHTITMDNMTNDNKNLPWGLFQYTEPDCVIKNLNVSGLMSSEGTYMGSIVGQATGTRIENCSSNITLKNSESTDAQIGGFIGVGYGVNFVTNCSFTGSIVTAGHSFGVIGSNPHTTWIKDCSNDKELINTDGSTGLPNVLGIPNTDGKKVHFLDVSYELDTENKIAKVTRVQSSVKAVHVAETIHYNDNDYTVKYIGGSSFNNSDMEYCYIPKTVNNIADDAFNGCNKLKYLHIADGPSEAPGSGPEAGVYMGHKAETHELFEDCPLEKVYIGRNLRWYSDYNNPDEPFEDRDNITDVFFGPRVTRVGNANYSDAREGKSYDLFNDCTGIKRVYIMGDDQSLKEKNLEFWCVDGLGKATDYYINRNIAHTDQFVYTPGLVSSVFVEGCLDACEHVTYGPFVKYITKSSFSANSANFNTTLLGVDFTNAFRLEEIVEAAFAYCHDAVFASNPFKNCNVLRKIGRDAFTDCDGIHQLTIPRSVVSIDGQAFDDCDKLTSLVLEDGDTKIKFEGDAAFKDCDHLSYIYQGRNYEYGGNTPFADCKDVTSVTIGPKVTKLNYNGYKGMKKLSITFLYSPDALTFEDTPAEVFYESKVCGMFIDRQLRDKNGVHIDWSAGDYDEEYSTKKNVENLSFGDHITTIPEHLFDHFSALKSVIIPPTVTEIGKQAFIECGKLENLYILGDVHIGREAFARCTNLKHLFLMGQTAKVDELVFTGCNNIEEVVTGFLEASDNLSGSEEAFTKTAYDNAHLVCAGDTKYHKIDFGSINPWKLFNSENRSKILTATDYYIEDEEKSGNYDHGYMPHSFTKDKYELVYAPFQMDSYYFGPKADIYKMNVNLINTDKENFLDAYVFNNDDKTYYRAYALFNKVDIAKDMTLPIGVYLVKTNGDTQNIASYHNLFQNQMVAVNNNDHSAVGFYINNTLMTYKSEYTEPIAANSGVFVCDGGVLKNVNGDYQPKLGEIVFTIPTEENKQSVFNLQQGPNTILSSKIDIPFNALLDGYASFYAADYNYIAPEWCKVYVITSAKEGEEVQLEEITDHTITKGQAVLLKKPDESETPEDPATSETSETPQNLIECLTFATHGSSEADLYDRNLLKGVDKDTPANQLSSEGFVYVLSCNSNYENPGFYKLSGDRVMPAGKAYLDPSGLNAQALAKACLLTFKDTATGIKSTSESMSESVYDLMGRRLKEAGFKGVYIVNGKKVVIK